MKQQASRQRMYKQRMEAARGDWKPEDYSKRLLVLEKKIMVLADVHLPRHDEDLLADAFTRAEEERVEAIVFLGDLMDMPMFSAWGRDDMSDNFERELDICEAIIRCAVQAAGVVYWSRGNHEVRLLRKMEQQISMSHLARLVGVTDLINSSQLVVSDNPNLDAFGGSWMLTHPAVYGRQPLVAPGKLATRYQQNIISAHAHHWAQGLDETSKFQVIESGGLFKPEYFQYIQYNLTGHRAWAQGYWIIDNGVPTGYRPSVQVASRKKSVFERIVAA